MTQSAVSLEIKGLSGVVRLLSRRKRAPVSLTQVGRPFLSQVMTAIRQLERAEHVGRLAARGKRRQIEVEYVTSVAMNRFLPSLLRRIRSAEKIT